MRLRTATASIMVVGPLAGLVTDGEEGPFVSLEGRWEAHQVHGHQFKASAYVVGSPRTEAGLRLYLASSGIKGVGPRMSGRILDMFGSETTHVLENHPERLAEVKGIGAARAEAISAAWRADAGTRALTILGNSVGLTGRLMDRIRERYGESAFDVLSRQPYRLAEEIRGIGFLTADKIARTQGLPDDAPARIEAACLHVVRRSSEDGHCLLEVTAIEAGVRRLGVPTAELETAIGELTGRDRFIELEWEGERALAVPRLYQAEAMVAALLSALADGGLPTPPDEDDLTSAQVHAGITLDSSQISAVRTAMSGRLAVITGGPGTGKTTLVRVLLRLADLQGRKIALASPTGRAARRLADSTGREASTLHRLLEVNPGTGGFGRNAGNPLESDGLVVDEVSMVDIELMSALLEAVPLDRPFQLILVGDADQLPSVGPGQVLRDLIASDRLPVSRLERVHRQAGDSGILIAASSILGGEVPTSGEKSGFDDFFFLDRDDGDKARRTIVQIVSTRLKEKGFDPAKDVQVLTPTRKGPLGAGALNRDLQTALNPGDGGLKHGDRVFRARDRLICTKNRYDFEVFNGDVGFVASIASDHLVAVFDGRRIHWPKSDLSDVDLGYAITVHKSQGSEYPAVVLALHRSHHMLLRRNLLYTAVTRAKSFFCGVGDRPARERAVAKVDDERRTLLQQRLLEPHLAGGQGGGRQ